MAGIPPVTGEAFTFYVSLVSQADTDIFRVNPTLAANDVKVSIAGGAMNNITVLPTVVPAGGIQVQVNLSALEVGDVTGVWFHDAAGDEWQDLYIEILTDTRTIGSLAREGADGDTLETLSGQLDTAQVDLTFLKDIEGGRWQLIGNQMIFYKNDNLTEIARFDLFDDTGTPTMVNVFERTRV